MGRDKLGQLFTRVKIASKQRRINKHMKRQVESRIAETEDIKAEQEEVLRIILEEKFLDAIEDAIDNNGGIVGLDGETISDILSYYIAGDPRFRIKLEKELRKAALRTGGRM
ncbi:hypothetical protein [Clostridium sp.]|uniref:hypothetical protein n=1 Tax=Clostridium sp. TaxID=1506 RepID=UPI003217062C